MAARHPPIDAEALLAHAGWMRRLAERLVVEPDQAEDVVQQSWVAALEHPPRHQRNLRGWLAQVVRNAARQVRRAESRRAVREKLAARHDLYTSPEELVHHAELHQEIVAAVLALHEPYRSTVLLRYYHNRSAQEIAELQGVPSATVRGRLRRGLMQLRSRLDERVEGGREAWTQILGPASILRNASRPPSSAPHVSAPIAGLLTMAIKGKLILGTALVGALAAGWMLWPDLPTMSFRQRTAAAPTSLDAPDEQSTESVTSEPVTALGRSAAALEDGAAGRVLQAYSGTVHDPAGDPIGGATLALYADGEGRQDQSPLAQVLTDAEGGFRIEARPTGTPLTLVARAEGHASRTINSIDSNREYEIQLEWAADLVGTVTDAETGDPIMGAMVSAWGKEVRTGSDGSYSIRGLVVGRQFRLATAAPGYPVHGQMILLPRRDQTRFDVSLSRGTLLDIEVVDVMTGQGIADAEFQTSPWSDQAAARTDVHGRAELRVAARGELSVRVRADGYCAFVWSCDVVEVVDHAPRIPMLGVAWIDGVVQRPDGDASPVSVYGQCEGRPFDRMDLRAEVLGSSDLTGSAYYEAGRYGRRTVGEDGSFSLEVIPCAEPYTVTAAGSGLAGATSRPVVLDAPGARAFVAIAVSRAAVLRGRARCNDQPWTRGRIYAFDASGDRVGFAWTDEAGAYELAALPAGEVHIRAQSSSGQVLGSEIVLVAEAGKEYQQDISWAVEMATISGRVTMSDGSPAPAQRMSAWRDAPDDAYHTTARTDEHGRYVVQVPPSHSYDLMLFSDGVSYMQRRVGVPAGSKDIDFEVPAIGKLRICLVDAVSREPVSGLLGEGWNGLWALSWRRTGEDAFQTTREGPDVEGVLELDLPVGAVDLKISLQGEGYAPRELHGLQVTEDQDEPLVVELQRGASVTLRFESDPVIGREQTSGHLIFLLEESELTSLRGPFPSQGGPSNNRINGVNMWVGDPNLLQRLLELGTHDTIRLTGLAPGRYWLRAFPDAFVFEPESFRIEGEDVELAVRWRVR